MNNMELEVNLNQTVKFKLTQEGEDSIYNYYMNSGLSYGDARKCYRNQIEKLDSKGFNTMQLHEFMNIFGQDTFIGRKPVIEKNTLIICEDYFRGEVRQ